MTTLADISVVSVSQGELASGGAVFDIYTDSNGNQWADYTGGGSLSLIGNIGGGGANGSPYMPGTGIDQLTLPAAGSATGTPGGTAQAGLGGFLPSFSNGWIYVVAGVLLLAAVAVRGR